MKKFEIGEAKLKELMAWLGEQPHKFAGPLIGFLQAELKEVVEEAAEQETPPEV